jgi:hypothetical protein
MKELCGITALTATLIDTTVLFGNSPKVVAARSRAADRHQERGRSEC